MDKLLFNMKKIDTESSSASILKLGEQASASPKKEKTSSRSGAGLWNQALATKKNQIEKSIKKKENQMVMQQKLTGLIKDAKDKKAEYKKYIKDRDH